LIKDGRMTAEAMTTNGGLATCQLSIVGVGQNFREVFISFGSSPDSSGDVNVEERAGGGSTFG